MTQTNPPKDKIPGGLADGKPDSDFDPEALKEGQKVEMEHTNDPAIAREIAKDHIVEHSEYYKYLKNMEKELEEKEKKEDTKKSCPSAGLEGLCKNCGSCYEGSIAYGSIDQHLAVKGLKCKYLQYNDAGKSFCSVYEERFQKASWCMPLAKAIEYGIFPSDGRCPYVANRPDYRGKVYLSEEEYKSLEPQIIKSYLERGQPQWCSDGDWLRFMAQLDDGGLRKSVCLAEPVRCDSPFDRKAK